MSLYTAMYHVYEMQIEIKSAFLTNCSMIYL